MKRKNMAVRLIRKQARGFSVGEWLYLFECRAYDGRMHIGLYLITEIKHHTATTVTFMTRRMRLVPHGKSYSGIEHLVANNHDSVVVAGDRYSFEFDRTEPLHRIAGQPVLTIVREEEEEFE